MYFTLGIDVMLTILQWDQLMALSRDRLGVGIATVGALLMQALFIWLVARRRSSWVRWLLLVQVVLGIPYGITSWWPATPAFYSVLISLSWLAQTVAVFRIFTGNSREWFRGSRDISLQSA